MIEIRDARVEDVGHIQDVFYRTWLATYPNADVGVTVDDVEDRFKDRHSEAKLAKRRKEIETLDSNTKLLVADADGVIVGICRLSKGERNHVDALYVLAEFQGRGIGSRFLQEAEGFFDPDQDVFVDVAEYNMPAIRFYEKFGFVDTGKRFTEERLRLKSGVIIPEMEMKRSAK